MIDPDEVADLRAESGHRRTACQCDGAHLRACPGPENCPFSGVNEDEDDEDDD